MRHAPRPPHERLPSRRPRARRAAHGLLVVALLLASCTWGTRPKDVAVSRSPAGADATLELTSGERLGGELLGVDASGVFLRGDKLYHVAWLSVHSLDVLRFGAEYDVHPGEGVSERTRDRLALVCAFRDHLNGPILAEVLSKLGQSKVEEK